MVTFFFAVRPFPGYALAALAAAALYGVISVAWSPTELDSVLGLLLFIQMFLASTGFAVAAHRGHYDPMLGHDARRLRALAAHWIASILPGLAAWLVVALAGAMAGNPAALSAGIGVRFAAFFIVSAVAWSAGYAFPRGSAGVVWMGILVWLLLRHPDLLAWAGPQASALGLTRTAVALLACPFLLIGGSAITLPPVLAAAGAALLCLLLTWQLGARLDVYLVERA